MKLFFESTLHQGTSPRGIGVCLLWTPRDRIIEHIPADQYTLLGNLYSASGINFLIRNLLLRPDIQTLVIVGKDLTQSGIALANFFVHGITSQYIIRYTAVQIHTEIPREAIETLRRRIRLIDGRSAARPDEIAVYVRRAQEIPYGAACEAPQAFPYTDPAAHTFPSPGSGYQVRKATIAEAYLDLLWNVLAFGMTTDTAYGVAQKELLSVTTVVTEPDVAVPDWMPCTYEEAMRYSTQLIDPPPLETAYSYGYRLRYNEGARDQIHGILNTLRGHPESRRAFATVWVGSDQQQESPPCMVSIQAFIRDQRLTLIATFRSHDIAQAWPLNAYGLQALQHHIATQLMIPSGDLVITSHSAHIYEHTIDAAQDLVNRHRRVSRHARDPYGSFSISLERNHIVIRHYSPAGNHLQTFTGTSAKELTHQVVAFVGTPAHAFYLGRELMIAELCLIRCVSYTQDQGLPNIFLPSFPS